MHHSTPPSLGTRVRYWIDSVISRGVLGMLLLAIIGSALLLLVVVPVLWGLGKAITGQGTFGDFLQQYWTGFSGLFKVGSGKGPWLDQLAGITFAIIAIFFTGTVFGAVIKSVNDKVQSLRDTGGTIVASDHTVLLGWSSLGPRILDEIAAANEFSPRAHLAVLTDGSKATLEKQLGSLKRDTTRIDVRPGSATSMADLDRVRMHAARSVIVLGPWLQADHDADVISSLLAVARYRELHPEFDATVVACLLDPNNVVPARVAAKYDATILDAKRLLARMMLQMTRQPGLYWVYSTLLAFEGCEFYSASMPALVGRTLGEAALLLPDAIPVGLRRGGEVLIQPPQDTVILATDEVVVVADDARLPSVGDAAPLVRPETLTREIVKAVEAESERWLFIGWSDRIPDILDELDRYRHGVTEVTLAVAAGAREDAETTAESPFEHVKADVRMWTRRDNVRAFLDSLDVTSYDYVALLSPSRSVKDDADTVVRLLHVRDIVERGREAGTPGREPAIVSELLQDAYVKLSDTSSAKDFVVSSEIVSTLLAGLSERPWLADVYEEIFDADGSEVYLRPAEWYVTPGVETTFASLVQMGLRRDEIVLGYRVAAHVGEEGFGVRLNPRKDSAVTLNPGDQVVVIAVE